MSAAGVTLPSGEVCEVCGKPATDSVRDVNGGGPWVAVCGDTCADTLSMADDDDATEYAPACPACGTPVDYCMGHGEIADPDGAAILRRHDDGDHKRCDPAGCDDAPASLRARIVENGRAVQVWWIPGIGVEPSRQRVAAAARAESGGHPIRYRQTLAEMGRTTAVYSREVTR